MSQEQITQTTSSFIPLLNEAVQEGKITNWFLERTKKRRNNIYVEKDYKVESLLESKREEVSVMIYKEKEDEMNRSSFVIRADATPEEFKEKLSDTIFICSQAQMKPYALPTSEDENVNDDHVDYTLFYDERFIEEFEKGTQNLFVAKQIELLKDLIETHSTPEKKVILNALEFFNTYSQTTLESSTKIEKSTKKTSSYLEFILTCRNTQGNETEHIVYQNIDDIYSFDFKALFEDAITSVKQTADANKAHDFEGPIILNKSAVVNFFAPDLGTNSLTIKASSRLKFMKIFNYEVGDQILDIKGDPITFYSNPLVNQNNASHPFSHEGISSKRVCLIENGVLKTIIGGKQYADYLGIEATGVMGVTEVEAGSLSLEEIFDESEAVEIVTFSSFHPDTVTGDFSAEIRLGYLYKDGEKIPFKGGLFTGNVLELLSNARLSKETMEETGYLGPKAIKFSKGKVVGL